MDLTPAFFDRWREHRELVYLDRVREIFNNADFDAPWLEEAKLRTLAHEAHATLRLSGIEVDEETVKAVVDRGETEGLRGSAEAVAAAHAYGDAHAAAMAAAAGDAAVTPALLDDLQARLLGRSGGADPSSDAPLAELCDWLAAPPEELHPVVTAAVAHLELLRLRRWADGNARLARLGMLLLLSRDGYDYRGLLAPSAHWHDPRQLPDRPAEKLPPQRAETHPAVEHLVAGVARALRDTVSWVRTEESAGSLQAMLFAFPLQP